MVEVWVGMMGKGVVVKDKVAQKKVRGLVGGGQWWWEGRKGLGDAIGDGEKGGGHEMVVVGK